MHGDGGGMQESQEREEARVTGRATLMFRSSREACLGEARTSLSYDSYQEGALRFPCTDRFSCG